MHLYPLTFGILKNKSLRCLFVLDIRNWETGNLFWWDMLSKSTTSSDLIHSNCMYSLLRALDENLLEYSLDIRIDGNILINENCVPYKYYISKQSKPYEFLHGIHSEGEVVNRCLQVPSETFQFGGMLGCWCQNYSRYQCFYYSLFLFWLLDPHRVFTCLHKINTHV